MNLQSDSSSELSTLAEDYESEDLNDEGNVDGGAVNDLNAQLVGNSSHFAS